MRNKLFLFVFLFAVLAIVDSHAFERKKYNFNSEWRLQIGDFPEAKPVSYTHLDSRKYYDFHLDCIYTPTEYAPG